MATQNSGFGQARLSELLAGVRRVFFIGVGGVHMSTLALMTHWRGLFAAGSDRAENENTARVRRAGIPVFIGHDAAHLAGFDAVVYTLAVGPENPEYAAAAAAGLPLISRAEYLAYLMSPYPCRIGVAGSHGKSTVTAWLTEIFHLARRSPTAVCGAVMRRYRAPFTLGTGRDFIFEACEYQRSFLAFHPTLAVLLNAAYDHVDAYPDPAALQEAFTRYLALPGEGGRVLVGADDEAALKAAGSAVNVSTFGLSETADYHPLDLTFDRGRGRFLLATPDGILGRATLSVPGAHNVKNALAAAAAAHLSGVDDAAVLSGLSGFSGAARRMEYRGQWGGARLFDDYAHHPDEIAAALSTARQLAGGAGRLFAVFQSHTYSRTAAFFDPIAASLRLADRVFVTDIYPARETETLGMSGEKLAAAVGEKATYAGDLAAVAAAVKRELSQGDLLLVMGAGDVDRIFAEFS